jgi:tetratricopeptide (TPR) repeat protein
VLSVLLVAAGTLLLAQALAAHRLRRELGQVEALYERRDYDGLAAHFRRVLERRLPARTKQAVRIFLANALISARRLDEAVDELDRVSLKDLGTPGEVAMWLNNRAYALALLGRPEEALEHLDDARDLLLDPDGENNDGELRACLTGNRGIALLGAGRLEEAEATFRRARDEALARPGGATEEFEAEYEFWLSELARLRGQGEAQRAHLERAAGHARAEYGLRAREALRALPAAG